MSPQATSPHGYSEQGDEAPVSLGKMLESTDDVLGVGTSIIGSPGDGAAPTPGVTKSVVLQRDLLKKASAKWLDGYVPGGGQ